MKLNKVEVPTQALTKYIPEGHSPKLYVEMVKQIMGVEKMQDGTVRPRSDEDFLLFMMTAKRVGLDPVAKQIYPIFRWDSRQAREVMTIQTGIDGFRAVASRQESYAGSDDAQFSVETVYDPRTQKEEKDLVARITVYKVNPKNGERMPITASARFKAYAQKKRDGSYMGLWAGELMYNQLAKCAEALALRKAFPNDLSGIYTKEEMGQTEVVGLDLAKPNTPKMEGKIVEPAAIDSQIPKSETVAENSNNHETVETPKVEVK